MTALRIFKETAVPGSLQAHAIYLVAPAAHPGYLEVYVTDAAGTAHRRTPRVTDIEAMIDTALAGMSGGATIVDNIAARNALSPTNGQAVLVIDASADATVTSGAATYVWRASTSAWVKISEAESLDISLEWANITGRPSSSAAAIDAAVANSHSHSNKTQLDKVGEDGAGLLTYNGSLPATGWQSTSW